MKLKKIYSLEHRKRRKKRRGSMEKNNEISKEDDELYAKMRKKENAKPKKMMFLVVLLASISTCHGVNRPHSVKGKDDSEGLDQSVRLPFHMTEECDLKFNIQTQTCMPNWTYTNILI